MTQVSADELRALAEELYIGKVIRELGATWSEKLQRVLLCVQQTHRAVSTERLAGGLLVAYFDSPDYRLIDRGGSTVTRPSHLTTLHDGVSPLAIQLLHTGEFKVWHELPAANPSIESYLLYEYRGPRQEALITPSSAYPVPRLTAAHSFFAVPYFLELQDALVDYGQKVARRSDCGFLVGIWREPERLAFLPKPESAMRRSLQAFLRNTLRNHSEVSVMPEQRVNETRPVDIKVVWGDANRVALIEIKWLGGSSAPGAHRFSSVWDERRAVDGAHQLVDYLEIFDREAGQEEARGYLVVFDARRLGMTVSTTSLEFLAGFHFRNEDIVYPNDVLTRPDFASPVRFFCEPEIPRPRSIDPRH